jgi:hypothetical protein
MDSLILQGSASPNECTGPSTQVLAIAKSQVTSCFPDIARRLIKQTCNNPPHLIYMVPYAIAAAGPKRRHLGPTDTSNMQVQTFFTS